MVRRRLSGSALRRHPQRLRSCVLLLFGDHLVDEYSRCGTAIWSGLPGCARTRVSRRVLISSAIIPEVATVMVKAALRNSMPWPNASAAVAIHTAAKKARNQ